MTDFIISVDTEEEFDWNVSFSDKSRKTDNLRYQYPFIALCQKYNIRPVYLLDYPVLESRAAIEILKTFRDENLIKLGAHLHPWVTPPYYPENNENYASFPSNLSFDIQKAKLEALTEKFTQIFGYAPEIFKAGRYGLGEETVRILGDLGYKIDLSVFAFTDFSYKEGPDYRHIPSDPFWVSDKLFEIPVTCSHIGLLRRNTVLKRLLHSTFAKKFKMRGLFARSGLCNLVPFSPEAATLPELIALAKAMIEDKAAVLHFTFHSSVLMPGGTPYVLHEEDLEHFLDKVERLLDFCANEENIVFATPETVRKNFISNKVKKTLHK